MSWSVALVRELARAAVVIAVVAVLATGLGECASGTPGERAARAAGVMPAPDSQVDDQLKAELGARFARQHGLDRPLILRLGSAGARALVFDFGQSWVDQGNVRSRLSRALPQTLLLVLWALILAIVFGLGAALAGASRPGRWVDLLLGGVAALAVALPPVWLGLLLMRSLAQGRPFELFPIEGISVLPVLALAVVPGFVLARHARAALTVALAQPWAVTERARGASEFRVAGHALRVEAGALLPLGVSMTAYLFGSAVVIEELFGVAGIGRSLVHAAGRGDQPTVVGACVVLAACIAVASSIVELGTRAADPRRRDAP